jgi:hypothetical protein
MSYGKRIALSPSGEADPPPKWHEFAEILNGEPRRSGELGSFREHGDGRPDRGGPKPEQEEHQYDQRPQIERMEGRPPKVPYPRPNASALQPNSVVHRLLPDPTYTTGGSMLGDIGCGDTR